MFKFLTPLLFASTVKIPSILSVLMFFCCLLSAHMSSFTQLEFYVSEVSRMFMFLTFLVLGMMQMSVGASKLEKKSISWFIKCTGMICLLVILSFCPSSLFNFYFFLESTMIPTLAMILVWGNNPERLTAGVYLAGYLVMSMLPLILMLGFVGESSSVSVVMLQSPFYSDLVFFCCVIGLMVKAPVFPFHLWLPKAHVESPLGGSMILAGVLLKMGVFGVILVGSLFCPSALMVSFISSMALAGGAVSCATCIRQVDMKSMIAYSSVCHMSMVVVSAMTLSNVGVASSVMMSMAHGVISPLMLSVASVCYEMVYSRSFTISIGAFSQTFPARLAMFLVCMSAMSVPPIISLLSEMCMVLSIVAMSKYATLFCFIIFFMTAFYVLHWYYSLSMSLVSSVLNPGVLCWTSVLLTWAVSLALVLSLSLKVMSLI